MPIIVNQINSPLNATEQEVISTALKKLGSASKHVIDCEIHKSSLDARKRNDIHFVHSVFVTLDSADLEKKLCEKNTSLTYVERSVYKPVISTEKAEGKVVIAGFGPAGMFAGLALAEENPIKVHPNIIYSTFCGSRMFLFSVSPLSRNL